MSKKEPSQLISQQSSLFIIFNLLVDCDVEYELVPIVDQVRVIDHCTLGLRSPWVDEVIEADVEDDMNYLRQISNGQTITICSLSEYGGFYYSIKK